MKKTLDQRFELEDSKERKADCRVRVFVPIPDGEMKEAVVLVSWSPQVPDFPTGPWLETIVTSFRGGLATLPLALLGDLSGTTRRGSPASGRATQYQCRA